MADKPDDDAALRARLDALAGGLERQRSHAHPAESSVGTQASASGRALSVGFRALSEFVAGVAVGALIGWQIDVWFGTSPFGLVIFLMLGTAAGFWNVYRVAAAAKTSSER